MIILAYDHGGTLLMQKVKEYLDKNNLEYKVFCSEVFDAEDSYSEITKSACNYLLREENGVGIFCCRSGVGTAIMSNRFQGIRAVVGCNLKMVKYSRLHQDANVLVLPADYICSLKAKMLINKFFKTKFLHGRHLDRIKIFDQPLD